MNLFTLIMIWPFIPIALILDKLYIQQGIRFDSLPRRKQYVILLGVGLSTLVTGYWWWMLVAVFIGLFL